jgi:anion-transporting  ArsA/GET3 family ATPase
VANGRPRSTIEETVRASRLLVCVGPGGVGKTTFAAAVATGAARRGRRVALLTIDPARRLADALGLAGLDDREHSVALPTSWGPDTGTLAAAMLETRASYDRLIERSVADPKDAQRIFENPVYRAFSRTLARSHAYVAMERVHELEASGQYDLVVVDTPPLRSALEILDAPGRLARFLDDDVVRWFVDRVPAGTGGAGAGESGADESGAGEPGAGERQAGESGADERQAGEREASGSGGAVSNATLRLLGRVTSRPLIEELTTFLRLFASMREGFTHRATYVTERLRAHDTSFVLVTAAERTHLDDARYLRDGLYERDLVPRVAIFNRSFAPEPRNLAQPVESGVRRTTQHHTVRPDVLPPARAQAVHALLRATRQRLADRNAEASDRARAFSTERTPPLPYVLVPELPEAPADLHAVAALFELVCTRAGATQDR